MSAMYVARLFFLFPPSDPSECSISLGQDLDALSFILIPLIVQIKRLGCGNAIFPDSKSAPLLGSSRPGEADPDVHQQVNIPSTEPLSPFPVDTRNLIISHSASRFGLDSRGGDFYSISQSNLP